MLGNWSDLEYFFQSYAGKLQT